MFVYQKRADELDINLTENKRKDVPDVSIEKDATDPTKPLIKIQGVSVQSSGGLPAEANAGHALIHNGVEWTKQDGYGYTSSVLADVSWNGDTASKHSITLGEMTLYKISDTFIPYSAMVGAQLSISGSETQTLTAENVKSATEFWTGAGSTKPAEESVDDGFVDIDAIAVVSVKNAFTATYQGSEINFKAGTYFCKVDESYVARLYSNGSSVQPIAEKYLTKTVTKSMYTQNGDIATKTSSGTEVKHASAKAILTTDGDKNLDWAQFTQTGDMLTRNNSGNISVLNATANRMMITDANKNPTWGNLYIHNLRFNLEKEGLAGKVECTVQIINTSNVEIESVSGMTDEQVVAQAIFGDNLQSQCVASGSYVEYGGTGVFDPISYLERFGNASVGQLIFHTATGNGWQGGEQGRLIVIKKDCIIPLFR